MGTSPILKEEIHTVILIPLWLCPGGGGCTWDPGGPRTIYMSVPDHLNVICMYLVYDIALLVLPITCNNCGYAFGDNQITNHITRSNIQDAQA